MQPKSLWGLPLDTTNSLAEHIRAWRPAANSIAGIAAAAAIVVTAGICSAASPVRVSCALPYYKGSSDTNCVGYHTVTINTLNTDSNAKVTAEMLGLDVNGNLINSFTVKNGDKVEMGSRIAPVNWIFIKNEQTFSEIFAPVPLLHVTVDDQGQQAEAYCSNIPYVDVIQPNGGVVSDAAGSSTNVLAAVPLTNPQALHLFVDGTDLLSQVPNYLTCTPTAPCSGTATINGQPVGYSNLIVDVAFNISSPASNTVQATLTNLTCGGHGFKVASAKLSALALDQTQDFQGTIVTSACNADSLSKSATSSVFSISITNPTPLETNLIVPTPVAGQVCSGTQITDVNINGKDLSVAGETFTPGNGTTTGNVYIVPINTTLSQTDLVRDAFGTHDAPLGTFDAGSNRLAASATDVNGNRTFKNVIIATGSIAQVAVDPNATFFQSAAIQSSVNSQLEKFVEAKVQKALSAPTNTDLQNAFVVGLSASATQTMFNSLCTTPVQSSDPSINGLTPGQIFSNKVKAAISASSPPSISISPTCVFCTATVNVNITEVDVGTDVSCNLTFNNGSFHVTMGLPNVHVVVQAKGSCEDDACIPLIGCTCADGVAIAVQGTADVTGVSLGFDVTQSDIQNATLTPTDQNPIFVNGTTTVGAQTNITNDFGDSGISFCGISSVCQVLIDIFTLGEVNIAPSIDISKVSDFSKQIGDSKPDPVNMGKIKVDSTVVQNFQQKLSGDISSVTITPNGITAGLVGHFASLAVDTSVPATPGVTLTPAPVPTLPVPNAKDVFIGISDDAINMMFASLTGAGKLQTGASNGNGCTDTGQTLGSLLPPSCDSLTGPTDAATVGSRAFCHAIKGDTCGSLTFNDPALTAAQNAALTATEQGVCYGAQGLPSGQSCSSVAKGNLVEWAACKATPDFNLHPTQPLLFCAKGDVPPRMLFPDTGATATSVPAVLRIPSLSVELVIDRNGDHQAPGAFANLPGCFDKGKSSAADCNVFSSCLSLNLDFTMAYQMCSQDGKPGFLPTFKDIQVLNRQVGTVCGGATSPTSDSSILQQSSSTQITIPLGQNGAQFAPPICGAGLDLGGFVTCTSPSILSIRTENIFPESRDYLAITCQIQ